MSGLPEIQTIRAFSATVERRAKSPSDSDPAGAFLIVQADHLREINSRYGQGAGDEAVALIAMAIRMSIRDIDIVGHDAPAILGELFAKRACAGLARRKHHIGAVMGQCLCNGAPNARGAAGHNGGAAVEKTHIVHLGRSS